MEKEQLVQYLTELFPGVEIHPETDPVRLKVESGSIHETLKVLRDDSKLRLDYLFNQYGIDREDRFSLVYHLESTGLKHLVAVETDLTDHDNPSVDSVSDLWRTAEFQEREIYDLMGVQFRNHPDPRRLFLDEGWGFPLRKDYKDEINIIER